MSGPNDSGAGATAVGDFKLDAPGIGAPAAPSERFKLKIAWRTPHLEWRPIQGSASAPPDGGAPPPNPEKAVEETDRYFKTGLLFDLRRPNWALVDKAFLTMPTERPILLPSLAQIRAWEDDAFYRRLGRAPPLFGAPAPTPLLTPPLVAPPPPSPFYKLPDPSVLNRDPGPAREGQIGDALKAVWGLPVTQRLAALVNDEAQRQLYRFKRDWDNMSFLDRATAVTLAASLAGGVVGGVMGAGEARHLAFKSLLDVDLPVPYVPGVSVKLKDYGRADDFLLGAGAPGSHTARGYSFTITVDVREAVRTIGKYF